MKTLFTVLSIFTFYICSAQGNLNLQKVNSDFELIKTNLQERNMSLPAEVAQAEQIKVLQFVQSKGVDISALQQQTSYGSPQDNEVAPVIPSNMEQYVKMYYTQNWNNIIEQENLPYTKLNTAK